MARYQATVETSQDQEQVFAFLSDFATVEEWDPGIVEAERLSPEVAVGSRFRVVAKFLGRRSELTYEIIELDTPRRVQLRGENSSIVSIDTIEVVSRAGGGAQVTYDAKLALKGPLRVLDPLLGLAFKPVGDRALAGLRRILPEPEATQGA